MKSGAGADDRLLNGRARRGESLESCVAWSQKVDGVVKVMKVEVTMKGGEGRRERGSRFYTQ